MSFMNYWLWQGNLSNILKFGFSFVVLRKQWLWQETPERRSEIWAD